MSDAPDFIPPRPPLPPERLPSRHPKGAVWLWPVVAGVAGLFIGALGGSLITGAVTSAQQEAQSSAAAEAAESAKSPYFEDAARSCNLLGIVEIADEGRTMIVDGEGEDYGSGSVSFADLECVIDAVGTPTSVKQLMYSTRSLDGRQDGAWEDVSASWGYHPDDGLDIIFELEV